MIIIMLILGLVMFILGMICFPLVLFMRARRDGSWDDSNMTNIIRLVAHIATHPSDFTKMYYLDGRKPFWYLTKDEFSEVVYSRPEGAPEYITKEEFNKEVRKIISAIHQTAESNGRYDGGGR